MRLLSSPVPILSKRFVEVINDWEKIYRMKNFSIPFLFVTISFFCYGQKKYLKPQVDTIRINKDSIDYSLQNGSLSFLKNCEYKVDMNINGSGIDATQKNVTPNRNSLGQMAINKGKRGLYVYNIKLKEPNGTYKFLHSIQIIIE